MNPLFYLLGIGCLCVWLIMKYSWAKIFWNHWLFLCTNHWPLYSSGNMMLYTQNFCFLKSNKQGSELLLVVYFGFVLVVSVWLIMKYSWAKILWNQWLFLCTNHWALFSSWSVTLHTWKFCFYKSNKLINKLLLLVYFGSEFIISHLNCFVFLTLNLGFGNRKK